MAIYEQYYQCSREPFSLSPDPSFLFASAVHREALAQLRYVVQERKGFAVVNRGSRDRKDHAPADPA